MAAGLALAAGRQGHRSLVVEINGMSDIGRSFGLARSYEPVAIADGVDWRSLTTKDCVRDFGRRKLQLGRVGSRVMSSRPFMAFIGAIPGVPDLLQLGKIENLLNEPQGDDPVYDHVFVDAPATGHGLSLLEAAGAMTRTAGSGPFRELSDVISTALADGTTGAVVVSLPERLPLSETRTLLQQLEPLGIPVDRLVVNRVPGQPVPDPSAWPAVAEHLRPRHPRLVDLTETQIQIWREATDVLDDTLDLAAHHDAQLHAVPHAGTPPDMDAVAASLMSRSSLE